MFALEGRDDPLWEPPIDDLKALEEPRSIEQIE
jgi:hypothetical protein